MPITTGPVLSLRTPDSISPRTVRVVKLGALEVLYSFDVAVAYAVEGSDDPLPRVNGKAFSMTTQRHIREWLDGRGHKPLDPSMFDRWLTEAVIDACATIARRAGQ